MSDSTVIITTIIVLALSCVVNVKSLADLVSGDMSDPGYKHDRALRITVTWVFVAFLFVRFWLILRLWDML